MFDLKVKLVGVILGIPCPYCFSLVVSSQGNRLVLTFFRAIQALVRTVTVQSRRSRKSSQLDWHVTSSCDVENTVMSVQSCLQNGIHESQGSNLDRVPASWHSA